jgi:hypothetical protein
MNATERIAEKLLASHEGPSPTVLVKSDSMEQDLSWETRTVLQLVKELLAFYGTRGFITAILIRSKKMQQYAGIY